MAPALTAEPLSPKEKLTSSLASPATGTRQSVRKLEPGGAIGSGDSTSSNTGNSSDTAAKKPATVATTTVAITTSTNTTTAVGVATRVTRSKDAAQRTNSPSLVLQANNKRKSNNNNNNIHSSSSSSDIGSEVKPSDDQMGLSAATTHTTSNDGGSNVAAAAAASGSGNVVVNAAASAPVPAAVAAAGDEHNNNCKDNSTAELLANLTSDFEEAITAEICLRKTLPDVSLSKEQPVVAGATEAATGAAAAAAVSNSSSSSGGSIPIADPVELITPTLTSESMTEPQTSEPGGGEGGAGKAAAVAAVIASLTSPPAAAQSQCPTLQSKVVEQLAEDASEIHDSIEERLSQLDGSPSVVLPPIVDISPAELEAANAAITAATADVAASNNAQQQQLQVQDLQLQQQQQVVQQQEQQLHTDILATPQAAASGASARQSVALLTPQSTASSINFLKDGAAGAVLEDPDIDEVLTALKTLDGNAVQTICDFNFFNEVCFLNNEEEAAAAAAVAAATGTAAGSAAAAGVGTATAGTVAAAAAAAAHLLSMSPTKDNCVPTHKQRPWQESHAELELQRQELARKTDFLLRRMRKFQVRQMCRHASEEIAGILEWSARTSHKAAPVRSAKLSEQEDTVLSIVSGRPGVGFWEEQTKNPLPASQMSNVLRHIETAARKQQICHTIGGGSASLASSSSWYSNAAQPGKRARKQQQAIDATTTTGAGTTTTMTTGGATGSSDAIALTRPDEIVPNYDNYVTSDLTHVAGLLHTELREVQNAIDSDATESSSGGESADEMVNYNNSQQISLPITRRAVWRYSRDRAAIALRWSYLCTQVADLEMKIRQHSDVYSDLCRTKGDVLLEPTPAPKNGYKEQATTATAAGVGQQQQSVEQLQEDGTPADWLCSRTRPLMLSEFRKRKLFQTINMHTISKKAARPSNIKCGCQWPQVPCTLCTGRPDPTAPRELPETLMPQNRVALLDASYHPVLSFKDDVCQSIHLEAISRQPDWQYRVMRSQAKAIVKSVWKAERETLAASGGGGVGGATGRRVGETGKRRYVRRKERNNNNKSNRSNTANNAAAATANTSNNNNNNNNTNNNNNNSNINNNNNNNNNTNNNNKESRLQSGIVGGIVGVDSGNGTGTATTSSSSTPTTTPLVANMAKKQRLSSAKASGNNGSLSSSHPDSGQHNSSLISSNGNGAKKSRKSASSSTQQQQQHHTHNNNNNNQNNMNSSSNQQSIGGDASDSQWETQQQQQQQHSRRNSSETHGHRNDRSLSERRSRLIYDIDNIVIPYSIAAQTRVEILPYKEIPTPKWRIVDSDNEKQQRAAATTDNNVEQLEEQSNGCATQVEREQAKVAVEEAAGGGRRVEAAKVAGGEATTGQAVGSAAAAEVTAAATEEERRDSRAAATKGTTVEAAAVDEATVAAVTTDKTPATCATAAAATTDSKQLKLQLNNNNNNNCAVKEKVKKVNGLKQQLDKKKAQTDCNALKTREKLPQPAAAAAATPVSNGLTNGKLQSVEEEKQQQESVQPVKEKEKVQPQAPLKLAPPINGKNKKNNRIPVNHISKESSEKEKEEEKKLKPSEAAAAADPPPNKRPKLQLHNKAEVSANLAEGAATEAVADLPPPAANEDELEDTSDEAYLVRHQRALIEERRRFETFLKLSWTNRSRANRRADSRAESSGANTPDPASPAASSLHLAGPAAGAAGDNESIPSPLAQTMQHPLDVISNEGDVPATAKRQERRRTTSSKLKEHERRSATPDTRELPQEAPPFEELKFPLSEEVYQHMLEEMKTEPRQQMTHVHVHVPSKRTKSKSVSSNGGGDGHGGTATPNAAGGSRRSSKTKANKLATKTTTTRLNGGKNTQRGGAAAAATKINGGGKDYYDDGIDYEPEDHEEEEEDDDEEDEEVLLLEEDDDYHHHLAPQDDDDKLLPASSKSGKGGMDANLYSASIDAYLGEQEGLDEEELAEEDPFVDDDPNDPEWKRNAGAVRHERVRKRV